MESSGRRLVVPLGGANGGAPPGGGGAPPPYAVLQFVGYAHSPLPSPTGSSIIWGNGASPVPSPRTPGSPMESPKPPQTTVAPPVAQQQQQVATTFVQADTSSFKEVVQKLTGATDEKKMPITMPARYAPRSLPTLPTTVPMPPVSEQSQSHVANGVGVGPRKQAFKLHERRRNLRSLGINPPPTVAFRLSGRMSPRAAPEILSPSMLDLPSLVLSPVTPLGGGDLFDCPCAGTSSSGNEASPTEEEKAIAQKGFYLHPSPLSTPRGSEPPQLLPLFPVSPREGGGGESSS